MNQNKLVSLFLTSMVIFNVQADTLTDLQKCAETKDSLERLVCYDNLVKSLNNSVTVKAPVAIRPTEPKSPNTNTVALRPTVRKPVVVEQKHTNEAEFGEEHLVKPEESINEVFFTVKSVKKIVHNKLSITFENGQVWKQSDDNYIKILPGDRVKLSKGMLGVVYLKTENQNRRIKVKRRK
jgi:hypothetical protein